MRGQLGDCKGTGAHEKVVLWVRDETNRESQCAPAARGGKAVVGWRCRDVWARGKDVGKEKRGS